MTKKLTNPQLELRKLLHYDQATLLYKVFPNFLMELSKKYFRLEVEGIENIPKRGRALITPNHSGYSGFDALMLSHEIKSQTKRIPRVLTHHLWFLTPATAIPMNKLGFTEATTENGLNLLKKNHLVVLFPEGEQGNFKPTLNRYRLQDFRRGFVRMALLTKTPIIPTLIIGAEETHINISKITFAKYLRGTVLPLPLNLIPLPAKWKIVFLPPIYLPHNPTSADDSELVHDIASDIRDHLQTQLTKYISNRKSPFTK